MSKYDLSDARDFQKLTLGSTAGVLQTLALAGRNPAEWDILEGSYNGVLFHVFQSKTGYQAGLSQIQDTGGRRKVKYMFPYKDGQTTDDLGRKPETFDVEVMLHGQRYMKAFKALKAELDKPTPGDLIHPVRGSVRCVPEDYSIIHKYDANQALLLRVTFAEHNFTIGDIRDLKDTSVKGALSRALDAFSTLDRVLTNITGAALFVRSLRVQIGQGITDYKNRFGKTLTSMNSTFNTRGSADIPGLLPVNEGGIRNSDGTLSSNTFPTVTSPSDKFSSAQITEVQSTALAVNQITKDVVSMREDLSDIIDLIMGGANGQGALEFHDDILDLKNTAILLQDVLETGIQSSRAQIVEYVTPREMTLREVAFINGLEVGRVTELDLLNPDLESTNIIVKNTRLKVPVV